MVAVPMIKDNHTCKPKSSSSAKYLLNMNYRITNIREDAHTLTTFLTAQIAKWTEVVRTYDLDFGHALVAQSSSSQSRRGLIQDISNGLHGNFAIDKSKTFSVAVGTPNKASTVLDTTAAKIQCVNCFVTGSFTLAGHVSVILTSNISRGPLWLTAHRSKSSSSRS